jgi:hypothetical protein
MMGKLIVFVLVILAIVLLVSMVNGFTKQQANDPRQYNPTPDLGCPNC